MTHRHHHPHADPHRSLAVRPPTADGRVHRLGRRRFLAELGRGTFAVAILGGATVACSGDDDAAPASDPAPTDPPATDPPATDPPATDPPATDPPATDEPQGADDEPDAEGVLAWAQVPLGFVSAYVLVRGNTAAVVDTGTPGSADAIGTTLATLGVTFDDVAHVVLTHKHPDHVGSLSDVVDRSPSAVTYAGAGDIAAISSPVELIAVGDGDDVFGLQVIETPGHTPGSISLLDHGIGLLVVGDAMVANDEGTAVAGPPEQPTEDSALAAESIAKLAALDFEAVAVGHGTPVTSGAARLVAGLAGG